MIQLIITSQYEELFIQYLLEIIKSQLIKKGLESNNDLMKSFLRTVHSGKYSDIITFYEFMQIVIDNLTYVKSSIGYRIYFKNTYYPKTQVMLSELIQLVNYGSMSIRGLYIFTDVFKYIENNIDYIYENYENSKES